MNPGRRIGFAGVFLLVPLLFRAVGMAGEGGAEGRDGVGVPAGYRLVYEQHFDARSALDGFLFTDPAAWRWAGDGASFALELAAQSRYVPPVRSPVNIAWIDGLVFGDFVLEVDLIQTGREYGHRDMCLFFGMQDPAHFYYVHLATAADDHAHNVFLVNGAPRTKIARRTTKGVEWGLGVWHTVRLERRVGDGTIRVFFDDRREPVMVAEDRTFGAGWVGFGSFDDTGKVDNIRIWSPAEPEAKRLPRPGSAGAAGSGSGSGR